MITEDYCSYEVSKLLNEKGLNGMCDTVIGRDGTKYDIKLYDYVEEETTSCPTHQMAMKWLREAHGLFIQIGYYEDWDEDADNKKLGSWFYWGYDIVYLPSKILAESESTDQFDTYEEAVEAALKYSLENLI